MAKKRSSKKKNKNKKGSLGIVLGFLFILGVTFFFLVYVLNLPSKHQYNYTNKKSKNYIQSKKKVLSLKKGMTYEEPLIFPLDEKIKKVDLAILQSLVISSLPKYSVHYIKIEKRRIKNNIYLYQSIEITGRADKIKVLKRKLMEFLKAWFKDSELKLIKDKNSLKIRVEGVLTHSIFFNTKGTIIRKQIKKGTLILIIDDIGRDLDAAKKLISMFGTSINLSILPYSPHAIDIYNLCVKLKIPVLLHMPMEPLSYPESNPGPGALLTTMDKNMVKNFTQRALNRFPGIIAVNNHMGSKFTQNAKLMKVFLSEIKKRHLFFIDSMTTSKSVSSNLGKLLEVPVYKRDVFLDNKKDIKYILLQMHKAEVYSMKKGVVIVIGHPYKETIKALELWRENKSKNIRLASVRYLLKQNRAAF